MEFKDFATAYDRLCVYNDCKTCPIFKEFSTSGDWIASECPEYVIGFAERSEQVVQKRLEENLSPEHITWKRLQNILFPWAKKEWCLMNFLSEEEWMCCNYELCEECRSEKVPKHILEKFNLPEEYAW